MLIIIITCVCGVSLPHSLSLSLTLSQHPAQRLKLSQILDHPFMGEPSVPRSTAAVLEAPLINNHLTRTAHPVSLASMDSGHATQYTQSTTSSHTVNGRGGPMRATLRPRGIVDHIPPTVCSVSSNSSTTSSSSRRSHSRNQSLTRQAPSGEPASENGGVPFQGISGSGLSHRRTQSLETLLQSREDSDRENTASHSHSSLQTVSTGGRSKPLSVRNTYAGVDHSKKHSSSCGELRDVVDCSNKENYSASSVRSSARKTNSDVGSVDGRQRRRGEPSGGAPFTDRTNKSRVENVERKSIDGSSGGVSTGDKARIKTLSELVPPLNAARLRPIQQQTRSANVSQPAKLQLVFQRVKKLINAGLVFFYRHCR